MYCLNMPNTTKLKLLMRFIPVLRVANTLKKWLEIALVDGF